VSFAILTQPDSGLTVKVVIIADRFGFVANSAEAYWDLEPWPDTRTWMKDCLEFLDALLATELRIRVRKGWLGGETGAVWVPLGNRAGWAGDLLACRGKGVEYRFPAPWYDQRR
jgi:hypothetical protein